ncbi:Pentatricopeptide repeat-containing, chloroplastic-like protein [Gossypium australe]|uniref:Pentatricopeptide repeat-containing, chloroplastic-like protein n=1 Tax=Gossypium australe TaxID=47621 RepID=A0A5B6UKA4_9ROSI|nr:Pentatricopeptide repeat-containing, chloroplastic-like protein [Gossypium australe]
MNYTLSFIAHPFILSLTVQREQPGTTLTFHLQYYAQELSVDLVLPFSIQTKTFLFPQPYPSNPCLPCSNGPVMSMNIACPSPCSSSSSFPSALRWLSPLPLPPSPFTSTTSSKPPRPFSLRAQPTATDTSFTPPPKENRTSLDPLLSIPSPPHPYLLKPLRCSTLSKPLLNLSHALVLSSPASAMNASCTVSTPTPSASAKSGHTLYASSLIKSMLRSGYLPHVKAWSVVVSRLSTESPSESISLFDSVTRRVRRSADPSFVADSKPDTAAYNAVLNASANLGDKRIKPDMYTLYGGGRITPFGYDLNSPPLKPLVMSRRFRLLFIAYSTGLLVIEKGQVLMVAKEDLESLIESRLLDLFIGKVDILALSTDERLLAICIADNIYI